MYTDVIQVNKTWAEITKSKITELQIKLNMCSRDDGVATIDDEKPDSEAIEGGNRRWSDVVAGKQLQGLS
jgi:hypothetical protein